ncbi:FAD-dependent monooxygenase [Nocardia sp. NPDC049149]|uniref:FAD-dependent monooxygenase n=1 Tax=Nocardia sp. NPDC049149 TaxID=3364315 RepID=UPI0037165C86
MVVADAEVDVVIVGGGPVGLTARALLERWGVRVLLVEKRRELSPFPRSRLVNVRSMEIFRQLGVADTIVAGAFPPEYGRIRFRDTFIGSDFVSAGMVGINAPISESPVIGAVTSQDRLEPVLLAAGSAPVRFGVELCEVRTEDEQVVGVLVDHASGARTHVRARYLLAADGANSTVRQQLGIGATGPGALGDTTTVVFDADLRRWSDDQPAGVYFTAYGTVIPLYPEGGWAWFGPTPEDAAQTDWRTVVQRALGGDVLLDVLRVQHWVLNAFVADHFVDGRIVLAGDAAHGMPIVGGLGMNAGIGDVHNLCWKLAGVCQGWAAPSLLASYATERQPVAHRTLGQAVANTQLMIQVQHKRREQLQAGSVQSEVELPWTEAYFAQLGLVLGVAYDAGDGAGLRSDGVRGHSELPDAGTDYRPTPQPGHRMPHQWLTAGRSTLDALGEWFTLLTPEPTSWREPRTAAWPLHIEPLPHECLDSYDLGPHGALLVRPDGHIAAHWKDHPPGAAALHDALVAATRRA